ncbi:MAG: type II secretion system protein N [Candidatus Aminicenantes bacterium]|jgi:type II secretion system protein C
MKRNLFKKVRLKWISLLLSGFFIISTAFSLQRAVAPQEQGGRLPPLSLVGVIVSKDMSASVAILKNEQTGQIQTLNVGEKIQGFSLSQVLGNHIVLTRGEETYRIFLGRGRITRTQAPPQKKPEVTPPPVPEKKPLEMQRTESDVIRMEFNRAEIERRLEEELPLIMQEARFVPNMVDGRVSGFRITGLPTKSIISQVGIRRNDIVKKINDVELDSVEGMLDLYMKFKDESRFEVTIERSGKIMRILYILR